jgi:hypothetical protein
LSGTYVTLVFVGGILCKLVFFSYLRSPEARKNQINRLIWMQQARDEYCSLTAFVDFSK